MHKKILIGVIKGDENFGASALDYPGCVAVGRTPEEACQRLSEALVTHIEGMLEDGEELPEDIVEYGVVDVQVKEPKESHA